MLIKADLEWGVVASWVGFGCVSMIEVAGDNVLVDVGNKVVGLEVICPWMLCLKV